MSFIKNFVEAETVRRRDFLIGSALGFGGLVTGSLFKPTPAQASANPTLAWSYRDRSNPYWNLVLEGGEAFVESLGKTKGDLVNLINEGSSEKSLADVKALLAKTNGDLAIACDPNDTPNCRPVVEAAVGAGAFISTMWNKTDDLHPWDFGDNYVVHLSWSDIDACVRIARELFNAMGGSGGLVGLGGIASNIPEIERKLGMTMALKEFPDIKLLDYQNADWNSTKATEIMAGFLTTYGDQIKGVFTSNDTIAYGAIEALRAEGLNGTIPVSGYDGQAQAVGYVDSGDMIATGYTDPPWGGGIILSLAYHAAIGTFKPSEEPHEHREFYGPMTMITKKEVADFKAKYIENQPKYDWSDYFGKATGPIQYGRY